MDDMDSMDAVTIKASSRSNTLQYMYRTYGFGIAAACVALLVAIGCARTPAREERVVFGEQSLRQRGMREVEGRAIWVTRWDYRTADDVREIIDNCADAHFNIVNFQIRGNGTAFYKSSYEPWAWELTSSSPLTTGQDPGFDPLEVAIQRARKRGVELHAYMNVLPAWRGKRFPPPAADQLWTTRPEWFMADRAGQRMVPWDQEFGDRETFYAFLNPAIPEVLEYTAAVFREVAGKYDVDGIHLDYIRFPHEVGDFSYDPESLKRFQAETGRTPDEAPSQWTDWRGRQVSRVVQRIYDDCKGVAPHVLVSASVGRDTVRAREEMMQRATDWMAADKIDAVFPMIYVRDTAEVARAVTDFVHHNHGKLVFAGLMIREGNANLLLDQIAVARTTGAHGISIFAYTSLFPNHEPNDLATQLVQGPFRRKAKVPLPPTTREFERPDFLTQRSGE